MSVFKEAQIKICETYLNILTFQITFLYNMDDIYLNDMYHLCSFDA